MLILRDVLLQRGQQFSQCNFELVLVVPNTFLRNLAGRFGMTNAHGVK